MISNPTSIPGCFWWLAADSLSLNDGDSVSTWTDLSGSGNTVGSAGTNPVIFKEFQINGLPCLRFGTPSTNFSALSKFSQGPQVLMTEGTWFIVYRQNGLVGDGSRGACLLDCSNVLNNSTAWSLGMGLDSSMTSVNPSGWLFVVNNDDQGRPTHFAKGYTESSTAAGSGWLLRSERSAGPWHSFFLNGSVLGSSNATGLGGSPTLQVNSTFGATLGVGTAIEIRTDSDSSIFYGLNADIAEIACYSRALSDSELNDAHLYFLNKYFNGASYNCNLYISGATTSTSASGNFNTLIEGKSTSNSSINLSTLGGLSHSGNIPLYTESSVSINGAADMSIFSSVATSGGAYLYTTSNSGIAHNDFSLYTESSITHSSGTNLYTQSANAWGNSFSGYIANIGSGYSSTTLYTHSATPTYNQFDMFGSGHGHIIGVRGLMTRGWAPPTITKQANLYTLAAMPPARTIYSPTNIYIKGASIQSHMNMVTVGSGHTGASYGTTMYLKTRELINPVGASTEIFVQNSFMEATRGAKIYIRGDGLLDGGSIARASMPLYINRVPGDVFNMYISGASSLASGVGLYSVGGTFDSAPLYVHGGIAASSGTCDLYTVGPEGINNSAEMIINGLPRINSNFPLYTRGF